VPNGRGGSLGLVVPFGFVGPVGVGEAFVLCLEGCGLGLARGGLLEFRVAAQVLEALAGQVVDVHVLDVLGGEGVLGEGSLTGDAGGEGAEGTEDDLVALQDELTHAYAELCEDADDGALGEHAVVVGDVVGELLGAHEACELQVAVGLAGLFGVSGVLHHCDTVLDLFHFVEAPS